MLWLDTGQVCLLWTSLVWITNLLGALLVCGKTACEPRKSSLAPSAKDGASFFLGECWGWSSEPAEQEKWAWGWGSPLQRGLTLLPALHVIPSFGPGILSVLLAHCSRSVLLGAINPQSSPAAHSRSSVNTSWVKERALDFSKGAAKCLTRAKSFASSTGKVRPGHSGSSNASC